MIDHTQLQPGDWVMFKDGMCMQVKTAWHPDIAVRLPCPPADMLRIVKAVARWRKYNAACGECDEALVATIDRAQAKARKARKARK